jgi:hypothetical protein
MKVMGRRRRRGKQLLKDLKEKRRYWKVKGEELGGFGRGYGPVVSLDYRVNE